MIRKATINDIDSIIKLKIALLREVNKNIENYDWDKYSQTLNTYYKDNISKGTVVSFLAEENETVVGISIMCFYNICPLLNNLDGKMALLTDMYTIPEYRVRGLGTNLLNNIMEYAQKSGYVKVILNATDSGRKLYEKYGFKNVNGEMSYKI